MKNPTRAVFLFAQFFNTYFTVFSKIKLPIQPKKKNPKNFKNQTFPGKQQPRKNWEWLLTIKLILNENIILKNFCVPFKLISFHESPCFETKQKEARCLYIFFLVCQFSDKSEFQKK